MSVCCLNGFWGEELNYMGRDSGKDKQQFDLVAIQAQSQHSYINIIVH